MLHNATVILFLVQHSELKSSGQHASINSVTGGPEKYPTEQRTVPFALTSDLPSVSTCSLNCGSVSLA